MNSKIEGFKEILLFIEYLNFEQFALPNTLKTYQRILEEAREFLSREISDHIWSRCGNEQVRRWIIHLRKKNLSSSSLHLYLSALRRFYKWFFREDLSYYWKISCRIPKKKQRLPQILSPDQVIHLINIPSTNAIEIRDRAILELFYSSGLRVTELILLQESWWSHDKTLLQVRGKGERQRWVPVGSRAQSRLLDWLRVKKEKNITTSTIFTSLSAKPLSARAVQKRVLYWGEKRLGINLHPHVLRHTFATHFLGASQDIRAVQEVLGHKKLSTTQRYTHLDFQKLSEVYDASHPSQQRSCYKGYNNNEF